jgi:hypothetical protein
VWSFLSMQLVLRTERERREMLEAACVCVCLCLWHLDIKPVSSARRNSTTSTSQVRKRAHYVDYVTVVIMGGPRDSRRWGKSSPLEARVSRLVLLYAQELHCGPEEKQWQASEGTSTETCAIERRCSHNRQTRGLKQLVYEALSY